MLAGLLLTQGVHAQEIGVSPAPAAVEAPPTFRLSDQRPKNERKLFGSSSFIFSCDAGVFGLGDKHVSGRFELLQAQLQDSLGERLQGKEISVLHYSVFLNAQARLRGDAIAVGWGTAGVSRSPDETARSSPCPRDKMKGGWFAGSEISTPFSPIVVEIEVTMDGRTYKGRSVHSPLRELPLTSNIVHRNAFKSPEEVEALRIAMTKANADLVNHLSEDLRPPVD